MPAMTYMKVTRSHVLALSIAVALLVLLFGVISQAGYVLSGPYLIQGATLVVDQARPHSDVFIDNRRRGRTDADGYGSFSGIKPGARNVIVAHTDSWPWVFDFDAQSARTTTLHPLQALETAVATPLLSPTEPVRERVDAEFPKYREPTAFAPLERQDVRVWVDNNTIVVRDGGDVRTVFSSPSAIRTVHWYGDRNDAVIVAAQNSVFALDIRENQIQNFQPIYSGNAPESVPDPIRSFKIFVRDGGDVFAVSI